MTQISRSGATFLAGRHRAAVVSDSIGPLFHFGQATKYGHMTKLEAAVASVLTIRQRKMPTISASQNEL
jgi:hypothetical protein